jgi:hypothetical protein
MTQAVPAEPEGEVAHVPRQPHGRAALSFYVARRPMICSMQDDRASRA